MLLTIVLSAAGIYLSSFHTVAALLCFFAAIWLLPLKLTRYTLSVKSISAILLFLLIAREQVYQQNTDNGLMTVTFIDVGQGDSTLIQFPDGKTMLIDAGTADNSGAVSNVLKEKHINTIDYLVGTHPHADHIGGMPAIIRSFNVKQYIQPDMNGFSLENNYFADMLNKALNQAGINVISAAYGYEISSGDNWTAEVLSPRENAVFEDLNDYSLIIKVTYGKTAFLFTGDAGYNAELEILDEDLSCDVLKVGHHGSFGSTCTAFLVQTDPSIGVISVGKNNENNLPNDYVLQRLTEEGVKILRTDESGTIVIQSDGSSVKVINRQICDIFHICVMR